MTEIKTDVDKLVALVKEKREVSVDEASKILRLNSNTVEALAESLEDSGILSIEYRFTQQFLIDKTFKQEQSEIKKAQSRKENTSEFSKDVPVREKVKSILLEIESDEKAIMIIKKEIDKIFREKNEIIQMINKLLKEESEIKKNVSALMRKANLMKIFRGSNANVEKEISEQFIKLHARNQSIELEIKSLKKLIKI